VPPNCPQKSDQEFRCDSVRLLSKKLKDVFSVFPTGIHRVTMSRGLRILLILELAGVLATHKVQPSLPLRGVACVG